MDPPVKWQLLHLVTARQPASCKPPCMSVITSRPYLYFIPSRPPCVVSQAGHPAVDRKHTIPENIQHLQLGTCHAAKRTHTATSSGRISLATCKFPPNNNNKHLRIGDRKGLLGRNDQTHHRMDPDTTASRPLSCEQESMAPSMKGILVPNEHAQHTGETQLIEQKSKLCHSLLQQQLRLRLHHGPSKGAPVRSQPRLHGQKYWNLVHQK